MCLIFVRNSQKEQLNLDAMQQAYKDNPDGVGVMWWEPGFGWKETRTIDATYDEVEDAIKKLDARKILWAIHFRWATAGSVSKRNCHPFPIGGGAYLMHNGVLPYTPSKKDRSDTWAFAQMVRGIGIEKFDQVSGLFKEATRGSRMLYALPDGSLRYSGDWVHKPEGYYSNSKCLWTPKTYVGYQPNRSYPAKSDAAANNVYYRYKNTKYDLSEYDEVAPCIRETTTKVADDLEYEDVHPSDHLIRSMSDLSDDELAEITARSSDGEDTQVISDDELDSATVEN